MKKNKIKNQEQKQAPRRLTLSRETIKALDDAALLEQIRGGATTSEWGPCNSGGPTCTTNSGDPGG
jgi:hypothetical protein